MIPFSIEKGLTMNMIFTLLYLTAVSWQDHNGQLKNRIAEESFKVRVGECVRLPCQTLSEVKQLDGAFKVLYWAYCSSKKCHGEHVKWSWMVGMKRTGITRVDDKGPYANRTTLFSNGYLEIVNVKPSDETVYKCTVVRRDFSSPRSRFFSLKVDSRDHSGQLKSRIPEESFKVRVGESVRLPCQTLSEVKQLDGAFKVLYWAYCSSKKCHGEHVKWSWMVGMKRTGITRVEDKGPYANRTILFSNGTLQILNVKPSDETVYRCFVNSPNYCILSSFLSLKIVSGDKPNILSVDPSTNQSWIGQTVQITCVADGSPTPSITWTKPDGTELRKKVSTENTVDVQMNSDQDFGNYTCDASNIAGAADTRWVQLNQIKPPGSPSLTTDDDDIGASSLIIKWTASTDDGGSPITGYNLIILHGGNVILNETRSAATSEYLVESLTRSSNYTLRVSAMNRVFVGTAREIKVTTKYEGAPGAVKIEDLPSKTKKVSVKIKWIEPQNNGAPIIQYTVYQRIVGNVTVEEWNKVRVIMEPSRREVIVELDRNKVYEFVVTATNKHGESVQKEKNIRKVVVLGGFPEPVVIVNAEIDDKKITLSWNEPEGNGAGITHYTIYKRISSDKKWIIVGEIKDISNRVFVVQVENTKKHEFVVTATNKYGESMVSKENIKIEEMPYSGATPSSLERQKGFYVALHIFSNLFVFLVIIIIVLSVIVWKIRRRQCPSCGDVRPADPVSLQVGDNIGPPSDLNTMESATDSDLNTMESATEATPAAGSGYFMPLHPSGRSWEVSREDVYVIKIIGKGAFSQVAQATVKNVQEHQEETTVAVKMLKVNAPPSDRKDLLSELELMKKLKPHPHVIKLIGCVTETEPLMVLIEYVPCGDLLGYLRKSRGLNDTYYNNPDVQPETNLTSEQLIKFAWQVADGMCYLSWKKIVHRDLAARNVLVGEGERCKVTDFGMARNVGQENIYTRKSPGRLPVKWTAYEALLYGIYTTQSDVWSYGILLYEILTVGGSPYPDTNAGLIANKIQEGYRMPKPRHVDSKLYEIMMKCWEEDPSDRPTFEKLRRTIKDMGRNHKTYVNLSQYDTRMYANVTDLTAG